MVTSVGLGHNNNTPHGQAYGRSANEQAEKPAWYEVIHNQPPSGPLFEVSNPLGLSPQDIAGLTAPLPVSPSASSVPVTDSSAAYSTNFSNGAINAALSFADIKNMYNAVAVQSQAELPPLDSPEGKKITSILKSYQKLNPELTDEDLQKKTLELGGLSLDQLTNLDKDLNNKVKAREYAQEHVDEVIIAYFRYKNDATEANKQALSKWVKDPDQLQGLIDRANGKVNNADPLQKSISSYVQYKRTGDEQHLKAVSSDPKVQAKLKSRATRLQQKKTESTSSTKTTASSTETTASSPKKKTKRRR